MLQSKILTKYPEITHFFGDKNLSANLEKSGIKLKNIISAEQIHTDKIAILKNANKKVIKGVDGMITAKPLILGIRTADCLPILFYDPQEKIIAATHAGWKGLYNRIIPNTVRTMKRMGSKVSNIKIAVGPHIQVCCYSVSEERIQKFSITNRSGRSHLLSRNTFSELRSNSWYLNLNKVAALQLNSMDIKNSNIDISDACTSCDKNYWSFRRDGLNSGRMISVISLVN